MRMLSLSGTRTRQPRMTTINREMTHPTRSMSQTLMDLYKVRIKPRSDGRCRLRWSFFIEHQYSLPKAFPAFYIYQEGICPLKILGQCRLPYLHSFILSRVLSVYTLTGLKLALVHVISVTLASGYSDLPREGAHIAYRCREWNLRPEFKS